LWWSILVALVGVVAFAAAAAAVGGGGGGGGGAGGAGGVTVAERLSMLFYNSAKDRGTPTMNRYMMQKPPLSATPRPLPATTGQAHIGEPGIVAVVGIFIFLLGEPYTNSL
jgi:hypothetical protein